MNNYSQRTLVMGIINCTPDSFSDGGRYLKHKDAIKQGLKLFSEGADIVDIGGVSTAPGRKTISIKDELARVLPVVSGLAAYGLGKISIDTSRAEVARCALDSGAVWINDQHAALADKDMPTVMASAQACVLMHNVGEPGVMAGEKIHYHHVVEQVAEFFRERIGHLLEQGLKRENIIVDPGIGFGKGVHDSLALINACHVFRKICPQVLIGLSRKSLIGQLSGILEPSQRDYSSLGGAAAAVMAGATIIRTHNVKATVEMLRVLDVCKNLH